MTTRTLSLFDLSGTLYLYHIISITTYIYDISPV